MVFGGKKLIYNLVFASITYCCLIQGKDKEQLQIFFLIAAIIVSIAIQGSGTTMVGVAVFLLLIFSLQSRIPYAYNIAIVVAFSCCNNL
mgnify:CR=1 FL=1